MGTAKTDFTDEELREFVPDYDPEGERRAVNCVKVLVVQSLGWLVLLVYAILNLE